MNIFRDVAKEFLNMCMGDAHLALSILGLVVFIALLIKVAGIAPSGWRLSSDRMPDYSGIGSIPGSEKACADSTGSACSLIFSGNGVSFGNGGRRTAAFSVEIYLTSGSGELAFLDNDVTSLVTADGAPASYWEHI